MEGKNHLERILYIDTEIRFGGFPSKKQFEDYFEVSAKTIERDFQYMRDRLGAPLEYNKERGGYYYSDTNYFLPSLVMKEEEIFALSMALETLKSLGNKELVQNLQNAFNKIFSFLPDRVKTDLQILENRSLYVGTPFTKIDNEVWLTLLRAIKLNRVINMFYITPGKPEQVERLIHPYYLLSHNNMWYVTVNNIVRDRIETYAVHRIKHIDIRTETFSIPPSFKIQDYIDPLWGIYSSTQNYNVKIKFDVPTASRIREKKWPDEYHLADNPDGTIIFSFKTNQIESVMYWLLPWGNGAKVLSPPILKDLIKETAEKIAKQY